ncbi:retinoic acid-induced protein 1 [Fundulus heteroclitus]|uniref:retinoic acid-induced protein 1 n=1 Tax=Fundulus heteroclitus TaxID=8078 RepID=UPI00165A5C27|nr:retinoic acid-induced protein 1 [Fundulus heteroclitus]XP_021163367.2 retinoic acid-induced protein 1 [Fundulus heteroclitus]
MDPGSSQEPAVMAMDLSKSYTPLSRGCNEAGDPAKKPEWYHRRPAGCSADGASAYRSSFSPLQPGVRCRDVEQAPEALGGYMNSTLDLFHGRTHGGLWPGGFYGAEQSPAPESSGAEESDSGSDVIFLVSSAKEPLLCGPFIQDGVRRMVEPVSPAASSLDDERGCYLLPQPVSSPSADSSYSDDSSDSSVDIPVHHARPVVLISDLNGVYAHAGESSDDSEVVEVSVADYRKERRRLKGKPPEAKGEGEKTASREVRRSARVRKCESETPRLNCGVSRRSLRRRVKNDAVGIYNESSDSEDLIEYALRFSSSDESASQPQKASGRSEESNADRKSPPQDAQYAKLIQDKRKKPLPLRETKKVKDVKQEQLSGAALPEQQTVCGGKNTAGKKRVGRRKRKRRPQTGPAALFSPRESEIMLKYAKAKEKKERKAGGFCPFVHMERRLCRVVNYQEEEGALRSSKAWPAPRSLSGFVPCTSCFQLGRPSSDGSRPDRLSCCLCGWTANTMGLGDLHGPYYAALSSVDGQTCKAEQSEDAQKISNGHAVNSSEDDQALLRSDRVSPAKVPPCPNECWIHEDCGIWSAGVFLVRGKLYGLEEAARIAQETICSSCYQTGAIMGCFQKGCLRNYHYTCAIQSGCILNEDNFSMRCPEHKCKTFPPAARQDKR